jgi:phosphoribosylformylglycinamidine synthase subunit PurS
VARVPIRVVVDVMPKPEISDPQGQAIARALPGLGYDDVLSVRQGKRFEVQLTVAAGEAAADEALRQAAGMAQTLLANPVIEDFTVRLEP